MIETRQETEHDAAAGSGGTTGAGAVATDRSPAAPERSASLVQFVSSWGSSAAGTAT